MTTTPVFPNGFLIAFDGIDGTGKTTQVERLTDKLTKNGFDVVRSKEPTDGPWGKRIRNSARTGRMAPQDEFAALLADRQEHVQKLINPSLAKGKIVILDRYFWSMVAYQGCTMGNPQDILAQNMAIAPYPNLTLLLDAPVPVCQSRIVSRDGAVNDFEKAEFLACCRAIFQTINQPHVHHIDGSRSPDEVEHEICAAFVIEAAPLVSAAQGMTPAAVQTMVRLWGTEIIPAGWQPALT